jgi:hypothetical protein
MKKWFIGIFGALVVSMLPLTNGGQVWAQDGGTVPLQAADIKFIEGPSIAFDALRGSIEKSKDAHVQITIVNSGLNDYSLVGEIEITLPRTLFAYSTTDGATGGNSKLLMQITNPIGPGSAESFDIFVQASPEATGNLSLNGIVRYWAMDQASGIENKVEDRSVSRDQIVKVVEATDAGRFGSSNDGSSGSSDTGSTSTGNTQTDSGSNASDSSGDDSGFDLEWWIIVLGVLGVILAVALVLGLFRIIFS